MELQPHQQHVVDEKKDLAEKIVKLVTFIWTNPMFDTLEQYDQNLMCNQVDHMANYCRVLSTRISRFNPPK